MINELALVIAIIIITVIISYVYVKRNKTMDNQAPVQPVKKIFTRDKLKEFNGVDASKPIYVGIHGVVYDVSSKRETYAPGGSYHTLAGHDATRALAKMKLDIVAMLPYGKVDDLTEGEMKTMLEWKEFFEKRYPVVGSIQP